MPADTVKYNILDVGQGSGNFIEMYESGVLTATVLIDLGSEAKSDVGGGLSVEFIVRQLYTMAAPRINYLFLSHSDIDHIILIDQLLDAFTPRGMPKPPLKELIVDKVSYGGDAADYVKARPKSNVLERLKGYMPLLGAPWPLSANYGGYRQVLGQPPLPIATVEGVDFYVLIANAPSAARAAVKRTSSGTSKPTPYTKNTVSAIVVMSYKGGQWIATGDATGSTLAAANKELTTSVLSTYFPLVVMTTAPHHGSEATTFSFSGSSGTRTTKLPVANFKLFVDNVKSKTISASAGSANDFRHPSAFLLSFFWPYLHGAPLYVDPTLTASNGHYYTAYFTPEDSYQVSDGTTTVAWPNAAQWYTVQSASNIYTNNYYDLTVLPATSTHTVVLPPNPGGVNTVPTKTPFPPAGVAWSYKSAPDGSGGYAVTVERLDTNPNLLALRREIIERSERMAAERAGLDRAATTRTPAPRIAARPLLDAAPPRTAVEPPRSGAASGTLRHVKVLA